MTLGPPSDSPERCKEVLSFFSFLQNDLGIWQLTPDLVEVIKEEGRASVSINAMAFLTILSVALG